MANELKITLPYGYKPPTEEDIKKAKKWTLLRNENASKLGQLIEELLSKAAQELTQIAYRYNCKPEDFRFAQDEKLREEVAQVMDILEDDIFDLIEEYSLNATSDEELQKKILPWLLLLHSKNTKNLAGTLRERLRQFLFDTEAQIAAMKIAGYDQTKAITRIKSTMHAIYTTPEVLSAFKKKSAAMYIKSRGVHYGGQGLSSSGAVNVENFGINTAIQSWSHIQYEEEKENGKAGFVVFRGSNFPCEAICDQKTGFHTIDQTEFIPPFHGHCCCYAVYVDMEEDNRTDTKNNKSDNNIITEEFKMRREEIRQQAIIMYKDKKFENKDVSWKATMSNRRIKEWLNQPHKHIADKNEALLDLEKLFRNAEYVTNIKDDKNRQGVKTSHVFKTKIGGESSWIIVHEMKWPEYQIYSIADNNPIKN